MKKTGFYLSLEILRGLCALEVVLWHCFAHIDDTFLKEQHFVKIASFIFLRGSDIAIIGFFVLSGFVTSASFISYLNKHKPTKAIAMFYIARMVRIWPLTFTTVLISVAVAWHYRIIYNDWTQWSRYNDFDFKSVLKSALGLSAHWNAPMWTLGYELAFYAVLPLIMLIVMRNNYSARIGAALTIVIGTILYWFSINYVTPSYNLYIPFVFGICIYFTKDMIAVQQFFQSNNNKILIFSIAILGIIYVSCDYLPKNPFSISKFLFVALAVLGLVFSEDFFVKHKNARIIKILSGLSACSYSLYLWHWVILSFTAMYMFGFMYARDFLEIAVLFSIAIPTLVLVTWMSWYFIERNARMKNVLFLLEKFHHNKL